MGLTAADVARAQGIFAEQKFEALIGFVYGEKCAGFFVKFRRKLARQDM